MLGVTPSSEQDPDSHVAAQEDVPHETKDVEINEETPFNPEGFEKLLKRECKMWQHRLRLQDWNVCVTLCRLNEMPDRNAIGCISPSIERKDAQMKILSPLDVPLIAENFVGGEEMNYGLTIVHELLHLHMWGFTQNQEPNQLVAEEQAINAISRALVAAYVPKTQTRPISTKTPHGHYL